MKIETKDLILKTYISKEDIEKIHQNVFSQNETAKYMLWRASNEIEWTKKRSNVDLYFVYEKANNIPIGFLTFSQENDTIKNIGLCIGKNYIRKGYGKQVLTALLDYCKSHNVKTVEYSAFHENIASIELKMSM